MLKRFKIDEQMKAGMITDVKETLPLKGSIWQWTSSTFVEKVVSSTGIRILRESVGCVNKLGKDLISRFLYRYRYISFD